MTERGPYGGDQDPTEIFPPLRDDPTRTPPSSLPPIGAERDPDPTRVMRPMEGDTPTTAMPSGGGPYDPGPPYGGPPGRGGGSGGDGGGYEPPYEPEPDPWYRQPGPLAALIAGLAAIVLGIIALVVLTGGDDDDGITSETLSTVSTTTTTSVPGTTVPATTTTVLETTTTSSTTTTTTTSTTTTTTIAPTTTPAPTTTLAPTTTPAPTPPPPPPGQAILDELRADPDLSTFSAALACTGLDQDILDGRALTVLAPNNEAFGEGDGDLCDNVDLTESVLLNHLVSVPLTFQQIFASDELQTLGERLSVDATTQTIGSGDTGVTPDRDIRAGDGVIHVLNGVIEP